MARMRETFWGGWADDAQAAAAIRREYGENGYLMDPHTAVGRSALTQYRAETGDNRPAVVLSTASPYKFPAAVLDALGFPAEQSGFAAMDELHARTGAPIPKNLAALRDLPVRHTDCVDRTDMLEYVQLDPKTLLTQFRDQVKNTGLDDALQQQFLEEFEAGLYGYTYLEDE